MRPETRALLWPRRQITIGLVNNMPDSALKSTEAQFCGLLCEAAGDLDVSLRLFYLPEIPRSNVAMAHLVAHYAPIGEIWDTELDGLIVTGTEPKLPNLSAEPYGPPFTQLADWVEEQGISTVWSCLAAHCAVQYMDRIPRRALGEKRFGLFRCVNNQPRSPLQGCPSSWYVPHSRYNELPEEALTFAGYRILTRSPQTGADIFLRVGATLHVFFQGHPEYDAGALGREYRRDVKRFLFGARDSYPEMPRGYFGPKAAQALSAFRDQAYRRAKVELISEFPNSFIDSTSTAPWHGQAVDIYRGWLTHITTQRSADITRRAAIP